MWIAVAKPSFDSLDEVDSVLSQLDGPPEGMEARYIGNASDGGLRVVTLWSSQEQAERFFAEKLGPAMARALGPEPVGNAEILGIDVARTYVVPA